jgi:hypothetical protein
MFQKLMDLVTGAGEAFGVAIPTDVSAVSDAVTQVTDAPGATDATTGPLDPSP